MLENHVPMAFKILPRDPYLRQDKNLVAIRIHVLLFAIGGPWLSEFLANS